MGLKKHYIYYTSTK